MHIEQTEFYTDNHFCYNIMGLDTIGLNIFLLESQRSEGVTHSII
jgi:hypothetical protein